MFKKVYNLLEDKDYKIIYKEVSYIYSKVNDKIIGTNMTLESFINILPIKYNRRFN
jgi:hypothetical protein